MGLNVIRPGLFTTIQDQGRPGYREWGVPAGGPFDRASFLLANALVGNGPECAALEMTLLGGVYEAQMPIAIALAGAPMSATILGPNGHRRLLTIPLSCPLAKGDILQIEGTTVGARTYLAVKGGWQTPVVLGSRSAETPLEPGMLLPAERSSSLVRRPTETSWGDPTAEPFRVIDGPDADQAPDLDDWLRSTFHVGRESSRMGLRLEGPPIAMRSPPERISMPVAPGAIQVAGGQLLVLGVTCGTLGGYPHLAHVIDADLDRVGQLRPGDPIRFRRVTLADARRIDQDERRRRADRLRCLSALATDVSLPGSGD